MTKFLTAIGIYSKAKYEQMIKKISKHYNISVQQCFFYFFIVYVCIDSLDKDGSDC